MQYNKTTWEDRRTVVNAEKLNNMEEGIYNSHQEIHSVKEQVLDFTEEKGYITTKILHDMTDLNTLNANGKYRVFNGINAPLEGQHMFFIEVVGAEGTNISQIATLVADNTSLYYRVCLEGVWSEWHKSVTEADTQELVQITNKMKQDIGNVDSLLTKSKEVVGAINELYLTGGGGGGSTHVASGKVIGTERVLRIVAQSTTNTLDTGVFLDVSKIQVYLMGKRIFNEKDFTVENTVITLNSTIMEGEYVDILFMEELLIDITNNTMVETHHRYIAEMPTNSFVAEGQLKFGFLDLYIMGVRAYEDYDYTVDRDTNVITLIQQLETGEYVDYSIRTNTGMDITSVQEELEFISNNKESINKIPTLESTLNEIKPKVENTVSSVEESHNYNTIKVVKTNGETSFVKVKTMTGDGTGVKLYESGRIEDSYQATGAEETSFTLPTKLTDNSYVELYYKSLRLINGTHYTVSTDESSTTINLMFPLKQSEIINYVVKHTSYEYSDLNGTPDLSSYATNERVNSLELKNEELSKKVGDNVNFLRLASDESRLYNKLASIPLEQGVGAGVYIADIVGGGDVGHNTRSMYNIIASARRSNIYEVKVYEYGRTYETANKEAFYYKVVDGNLVIYIETGVWNADLNIKVKQYRNCTLFNGEIETVEDATKVIPIKIGTTERKEILLSPRANITITDNKCYKTNLFTVIDITFKKTDGSDFSANEYKDIAHGFDSIYTKYIPLMGCCFDVSGEYIGDTYGYRWNNAIYIYPRVACKSISVYGIECEVI